MTAMRTRYPNLRLHRVESLSGHLADMLNASQLDLAVLFDSPVHSSHALQKARRWSVMALMEEDLFLKQAHLSQCANLPQSSTLNQLQNQVLILPTGPHGLRSTLDAAFARAGLAPHVVLEVDSLSMLMAAVSAGLGATLQPWAAVGRFPDAKQRFHLALITDADMKRRNLLCSLSDDEISPAALATRVVIVDCVRMLVSQAHWQGARLMPKHPSSQ